jgi:hypothetical protein
VIQVAALKAPIVLYVRIILNIGVALTICPMTDNDLPLLMAGRNRSNQYEKHADQRQQRHKLLEHFCSFLQSPSPGFFPEKSEPVRFFSDSKDQVQKEPHERGCVNVSLQMLKSKFDAVFQ